MFSVYHKPYCVLRKIEKKISISKSYECIEIFMLVFEV